MAFWDEYDIGSDIGSSFDFSDSSSAYDAWVSPTSGVDYTQGIEPSTWDSYSPSGDQGSIGSDISSMYPGSQPPQGGISGPRQGPMAPGGQNSQINPWAAAGLGAAPGLAGMLGTLAGGGKSSTSPNMTTQQKALQMQGQQALGFEQPMANQMFQSGGTLMDQLARSQNPLQQQQNSILSALAPTAANMGSGNMQIPPQLQALIDRAFDPYVGEITDNAIQNARNRGFAGGADLLGGPAGTIAGPGLANAAGMKANSLLKAMLDFPQASAQIAAQYNQPINQLQSIGGAAMQPQQQQVSGYQNMFSGYPSGVTSQANMGQQIGQGAGTMLGGMGTGYGLASNQNQQNTQMNSMLNAFNNQNAQSAGGMSGVQY